MARKTLTVTIDGTGRDTGKAFLLTEMGASQSEKWAARALLALMRGGVTIPDNIAQMGLAGLAVIGVEALGTLEWDVAEPLLEEMFICVKIIPDPSKPNVVRMLIEDDIEDVKTRVKLRKAVLELHIDSFTDAALLEQIRASAAAMATTST